jgi:hypothetical protein
MLKTQLRRTNKRIYLHHNATTDTSTINKHIEENTWGGGGHLVRYRDSGKFNLLPSEWTNRELTLLCMILLPYLARGSRTQYLASWPVNTCSGELPGSASSAMQNRPTHNYTSTPNITNQLPFIYYLHQWYSSFLVRVPPTCNFSSTLYLQSCWCIIQVIHSL